MRTVNEEWLADKSRLFGRWAEAAAARPAAGCSATASWSRRRWEEAFAAIEAKLKGVAGLTRIGAIAR
jgi:NADH dehydrogenase/NADH:ubiquinone oxidoreductase subunit G